MKLAYRLFLKLRQTFLIVLLFPSVTAATTIVYDVDITQFGGFPTNDITSMSAGYDSNALYLSLTYASGTFDPANIKLEIGLDTDTNAATSANGISFTLFGADYLISILSPSPSVTPTAALVYHGFLNTPLELVGTIPLVYGIDMLSIVVPLSLLGNDDGVTNFAAEHSIPYPPPSLFLIPYGDFVGNPAVPLCDFYSVCVPINGLVGPSTPIPEPGAEWLLALGLGAMLTIRRSRAKRRS